MKEAIEKIAAEDGRFNPKALFFVHNGLGKVIEEFKNAGGEAEDSQNHISGQDLARGLAQLAAQKWGRLARVVLTHWGVNKTRDLGEIVFLMIKNEWMTAQETDTIEDLRNHKSMTSTLVQSGPVQIFRSMAGEIFCFLPLFFCMHWVFLFIKLFCPGYQNLYQFQSRQLQLD